MFITQKDVELHQEYAAIRQQEYDEMQRRESLVEQNTPAAKYEMHNLRLSEIAERNCKTRAEWEKDIAEDMRHEASGISRQKSATEWLESYQNKIQAYYEMDERLHGDLDICEKMIDKLESEQARLPNKTSRRKQNSAQNKLDHWCGRKISLEQDLSRLEKKILRFESKNMQWLGIVGKIKEADIARLIREERNGIGNTYGFNPKAKSRGTAEIMHQD